MSMPRLHWGSRGTAPLIPYIGAIWRWVENFKIPPLYHTETTRYQLVELQNHSGNYCRRDRGMRRHCATSRKVAGSIPDGAIGIFTLTWSLRPHYGSGVDLASNKNEYREYFLGVKAGGVESWKPYHLNVLIVLKSGTLNFLEPSGPVQGLLCLFFFFFYCGREIYFTPAEIQSPNHPFRCLATKPIELSQFPTLQHTQNILKMFSMRVMARFN